MSTKKNELKPLKSIRKEIKDEIKALKKDLSIAKKRNKFLECLQLEQAIATTEYFYYLIHNTLK